MHPTTLRATPRRWLTLAATVLLCLAGCGGGSGSADSASGDSSTQRGSLRVALTDAPACGYDAVHVTIEKVRVHKLDSAMEHDAGWQDLVLPNPKRVDLLSLTNGVLEELGQTTLPTGRYTQLRLVLAPNNSSTPLANAVTPTGERETALSTPSAQQSGLKLNVNIDVAPNQVADVVLDFDACQSIVKAGASGRYNLKPVLRVLPRLGDAGLRVVGYVAPGMANANTSVSLQQAGVPMRATPPDATGRFVLYPVPEGSYDLVISAPGRVLATVAGVPVTATAYTHVSTETQRIDPPLATMRAASGVVNTATTTVDAVVSATKTYTAGPTVTVAQQPAHAETGAYTFSLPAEAPVKAAYVPGAPAPVFTADGALPAGRYTLTATVGGVRKSAPIDVSTADATAGFTFP